MFWTLFTDMAYMYIVGMVFDVALTISLGTLWSYHFYCMTHALTTLEFDSFPNGNPFDMGTFQNLKLMLGSNVWAWPIPIQPTGRGSTGVDYPMSKAAEDDENEAFL